MENFPRAIFIMLAPPKWYVTIVTLKIQTLLYGNIFTSNQIPFLYESL